MKQLFYILAFLSALTGADSYGQIYTYTNATNGAPSFTAANTTYTNLTAIGTGSNTPCTQGFSGITGFTGGSYTTSGPCVSVTVRPVACYQLNITGFQAGLRRSGTGPALARLAYSLDGGASWIDQGVNVSPLNTGCATNSGGVTNATWTTNVTVTSTTLGVIFRVYPFAASGSSGTLQIWGLNIYGTVPPCAPTLSTNVTNVSCNGGNNGAVNLNVTGGCNPFTYAWTGPNSYTAGTQNISGLTAGTYSVSVSSPGGCTSTTTATVTQPAAFSTSASNNGPLCSGGNLILSSAAVNNATYSWTGPNSFSSSSQNAVINNVTTAASGTYTVTATVNGCTASATTNVTINPSPTITLGTITDPTTCGGTDGSIILSGLAPSTAFTLNYTKNSIPQSAAVNSDGAGNVLIGNLAAGLYDNIIVTLGPCISNTLGPVTLSDPPTPATPIASANTPLCSGNALNLSASNIPGASYSWSGPNSFTSGIQNPVINPATTAATGMYSVTATVNGCLSLPGTVNVTVNGTPVISTTAYTDPTTCSGVDGSITLNGLVPNTSYNLAHELNGNPQAATVITSNNTGAIIMTGLPAGTYSNIVVTLNGCSSNIAGPFTLNDPATPVVTAGSNSPLCVGNTLNLTSTSVTNGQYSWVGPNGFTSTVQNPNFGNATQADAGVYTVTVTVNNCVSVPASVTVAVSAMPTTPVISSNGPLCAGNDLYLSSNLIAGATYYWSGPNGFTSNLQNPMIVAATTAASGTYQVYAQISTCISGTASTQVVVNPGTNGPVVSDLTYCQFETAAALTATGQNILWYTSLSGGVGTTVAPVPSTMIPGIITYYATQTLNNCESIRVPLDVTVHAKPPMPVTDTVIGYCQFETATVLSATGQDITWYDQANGGNGYTVAPLPQTAQAGVTMYYVTQTVNNCESDRRVITVTIGEKPAAPIVSDVQYCTGMPSTVLTAGGANILWYTSATAMQGSVNAPLPSTAAPDSATWFVTQTQNGCESDRAMMTVLVHQQPEVQLFTTKDLICQYDTLQFTSTVLVTPGTTYQWGIPGSNEVLSGGIAGDATIQFNEFGNHSIILTLNNRGCVDADTIVVAVVPAPVATISLPEHACVGEAVRVGIGMATPGIKQYTWNFDGAEIVTNYVNEGPYDLQWNTPGKRVVRLLIEDDACPSDNNADTIMIHALPDATIKYQGPADICISDNIELAALATDGEHTYNWQPAAFFGGSNTLPELNAGVRAAGNIWLTVTSPYGCSATDSIFINARPCCQVTFPTAFTPNMDGKNDIFRPITDAKQDVATFFIVNRWGKIIFESLIDQEGWDGNFNGVSQDIGTYYYYYKYKCDGKVMEQKGEVTLIR
jgi:gliding motility-associated-like protein